MNSSDKPKFLDPELSSRRELFFRYFHSYNKTYHETLWQLEEVRLLVRVLHHSKHNMWVLNESLYRYAESSISALNWLDSGAKDYPFVHRFLREWRNEYHHNGKSDFYFCDFVFHVGEEAYELTDDYFVYPMIASSERITKLLREHFGTERVATDATVYGLVAHHHAYIKSLFRQYERQLQSEMPRTFLVHNDQSKRALVGSRFKQFLSESEFWGS